MAVGVGGREGAGAGVGNKLGVGVAAEVTHSRETSTPIATHAPDPNEALRERQRRQCCDPQATCGSPQVSYHEGLRFNWQSRNH